MRYLFRALSKIKPLLTNKPIFLFLDYDGTLTPIRQKPALGIITKRAKNILCELSKIPGCKLAVISGRCLKDISRLVGLENVIYGGNHGLELKGPQVRFRSPVAKKYRVILEQISRNLRNKLRSIKGVLIENKGLSLSIHYRQVAPKNIPAVKSIFCRATAFNLWRNEIRVRPGKMVFEVFPPVNWNKGKAILWLLQNLPVREDVPVFPIYIGDDFTDEDAFKLLKNNGLTVFVGKPKKTHARYYVTNTSEVLDFLLWVVNLKSTGPTGPAP
jgi:trehalose 6-phosphate phosphatase